MIICEYLVEVLAAHGVRHVHGYPGASVLPLMGAVHRHATVNWVTYRNEANAALAASAYAKSEGGLGVCVATSGPGASNLVTGLLDAQLDGAAVVAITGMVGTWRQGRFEFQDVDAARLLGQFVPYSLSCSHPDELPALLAECLGRSQQQRCVTHLALPVDIQKVEARGDLYQVWSPQPPRVPVPSAAALDEAAACLEGQKVVIAVGPRARGAGEAIESLSEALGAPILTSFDGKGIIREDHPNLVGVLGIFGSPGVEVSARVLGEAQVVLSFGLRDLGPFVAGHSGTQARRLVQCESEAVALSHRFHRSGTLVGPLEDIARELRKRVKTGSNLVELARGLRAEFYARWTEPRAVRFLKALNGYLTKDSMVALDIGDNAVWASQFLELRERQRVLVSENLGAMGFCLPALIAARLAYPDARLVGIAGDGGVQMSIGELAVAVQHKLPFVLIVFRNGVLGRIQAQEETPFEVEIHSPDYVALARAYGADGMVMEDDFSGLEQAFAPREGPFVIELRLDSEVGAPMGGWVDGFVPLHFA